MRQQFFLLAAMALWPVLLPGQTAIIEPSGGGRVTKIVRVHGDPNLLARLAGHGTETLVEGSNELHAVVIKGKPADVESSARTVQELDAMSPAQTGNKDVELTVYVLGGTGDAKPNLPDASGDALGPVVKQLRGVFSYTHYYTLGTIVLRSGQDSYFNATGMTNSLQRGTENAPLATYRLQCRATASTDAVPVIHLDQFQFSAQIPINEKGDRSPIESKAVIDLREGQKVVVANSAIGNENAGLFLVVTARLVP